MNHIAARRDRISLVFMDEATFHEGVPANFKGLIPTCQVSPLVKYAEYSPQRALFHHRRLHNLGDDEAFLPVGLFGNPTNWYGADGTGVAPLAKLIPDLRPIFERHRGLKLLIDYSWEAGLGKDFFPGVDKFIRDLGIPPNRVLVIVSNQRIKERYRRFVDNGQKPASACFRVIGADFWLMYSAIELHLKHWFGAPESLVRDAEVEDRRSTPRARKFLSFNRRPRWHRFLLALMMGELDLKGEGFTSMSSPRYRGDWISEDGNVDTFGCLMESDLWARLSHVKEKTFSTLPWTIDITLDQSGALPDLYKSQDRNLFIDSYSQIVTESYMEGELEDVFITEKTCRALANLQPFLIFGQSGSLRTLKQHGFAISSFFDEEYDCIADLGQRLTALYRELKTFKSTSIEELHARYYDELDLLRFNRERLFEMPSVIMTQLLWQLRAEL